MGKSRFAPHTRRFAEVPRQPGVYIAELIRDDGPHLKVGACGNLQGRLMALQNELKREHAAGLGQFVVVPKRTAKAAYETEALMVCTLSEVGCSRFAGRREFFSGVGIEQAVLLLKAEPPQGSFISASPVSTEAVRHGPDGLSLAHF